MKRKLVQQGTSTLMVSLPSRWVKANKLGKGSEIDINEKGNIIILGGKTSEKREISIELNEENRKDIKNILTHAYRRGFDKITLKNSSGSLKEIKHIINSLLLGFEPTEITKNRVVIENISEPTENKYESMLKRAFQIVYETQDVIIADFKNHSFKNISEIEDLRNQQDRFLLFCRRLLIKHTSEISILTGWEILNFLMHIEHRYNYLYRHAAENNVSANKDIIHLLGETKDYFKLYEDAFYNKNIASIHKINDLRKKYYLGECVSALRKSKGDDSIVLGYIREIFRIIQLGTSPILADLIEHNYKIN